jgi:uncharacterized protein YbcI
MGVELPAQHDGAAAAGDRADRTSGQISRAIVGIHSKYYGRGPRLARTRIDGDVVVCVLEDIYTPAEATLIEAGKFEQIRQTRVAFQDAVEPLMRTAVEEAMGQAVRMFFSQVSRDPPAAAEVFVLHPEQPGEIDSNGSVTTA